MLTKMQPSIIFIVCICFGTVAGSQTSGTADATSVYTLDSVRQNLIRQEDSIIFSLIERSRFPMNHRLYDVSRSGFRWFHGSLLDYVVKETEAIQAKVGRFANPEENPFFPNNLPKPLFPPHEYSPFLHPAGASVNINKNISDFYLNELLILFVSKGDDGNYGPTAASDLNCLQVLSRRIHFGKFVAEVKFRDDPQNYTRAIRAQDRDGLMKLLTDKAVEESVKRRVEKKAKIFGQEVSINDNSNEDEKVKVDPSVVSFLYEQWVIPLTKLVQVEYLLRRLD